MCIRDRAEKVADPFGILCIIFVPFYSLHPFGIGYGDVDGIFQKVKVGNPIFPGGFHAHIKEDVINQPLLALENGIVKGGESLFRRVGGTSLSKNDCGDEKSLMHIDTTADRVNN